MWQDTEEDISDNDGIVFIFVFNSACFIFLFIHLVLFSVCLCRCVCDGDDDDDNDNNNNEYVKRNIFAFLIFFFIIWFLVVERKHIAAVWIFPDLLQIERKRCAVPCQRLERHTKFKFISRDGSARLDDFRWRFDLQHAIKFEMEQMKAIVSVARLFHFFHQMRNAKNETHSQVYNYGFG